MPLVHTCITRQPYGCFDKAATWPRKEDITNFIFSVGILSIHFCITWFPFWSRTHCKTCPSSSRTSFVFCSSSIASRAYDKFSSMGLKKHTNKWLNFEMKTRLNHATFKKRKNKIKFTEIDNIKKRSKKYLLDYTATVHLQT